MKMKCTGAVYVAGHGIVNENETIEIDAESADDPRIAAHFVPVGDVEGGAVGSVAETPVLPGLSEEIPDRQDKASRTSQRRSSK